GKAQYTSDFHFPGLLYAVPVGATIANGRIMELDTASAEKMPGVRAIFHRANIGKIFRSTLQANFQGVCEERRPPFEDDIIRYYGQYIALAVADTFETAKAAADAVRATYAAEKPNVETHLEADDDPDEVDTTFGRGHARVSKRVCVCARVRVCAWIDIYLCACMHECVCVCVRACVYAWMCVRACIHGCVCV